MVKWIGILSLMYFLEITQVIVLLDLEVGAMPYLKFLVYL